MRNFDVAAPVISHMRRMLWLAVTILFISSPALAGVTYDFTSATTGITSQTIEGRVQADGKSLRIDVGKGDGVLLRNGSVVLSSAGGQKMTVVDPAAKSYFELDLAQVIGNASAMLGQLGGDMKFDVRNVSTSAPVDGGSLEGFPAKKSTIRTQYDLSLTALGQPMAIAIAVVTDVWWTDQLPADYMNFLQMRGLRTGVEAVDKLLSTGANHIDGFPLKQHSQTKITMNGKDITTTTTSTVRNVKRADVPATVFTVPAGFAKRESPLKF
jgi:hypothetical protein